jgi:MFS family permease
MGPVVLIMAGGYFVGGALGDWMFKRTLKGRIIVSSTGVILGALFLFLALNTPIEAKTTFFILMCLTALFMPFSSPNVLSTVFDISLPEIRSSAQAVEYFVENSGAALAPTLAGAIALATGSKQYAIMTVCITAWIICFCLYLGALFFVDRDIHSLRAQMQTRADDERARQAG